MLSIKSGRLSKPVKAVIYGLEGTGKSTLAAQTPNPLFLDTEGGTTYLDVNRIDQFTGWEGLLNTIEEVARDPSCCTTLVIDTADWAEQMAIKHICEKYKQTGLESFGFGKGYTYLAEEFARMLRACENVLASGRNVVIVAHARVRKQELPEEMGAFDHWELKLSRQCAPLLAEWPDLLLFVSYKTFVSGTESGSKKASGGKRVMYATHHPCWDAKNRFGLPGEMPFDYAGIAPVIGDEKNIRSITEPNEPIVVNSAEETPDKCKDVSDAPAQAAVSEPAKPDGTVPDIPAGIPQALRDLMQANNVTATDIQTAVSAKGYFPLGMEITDYPADFVNGCLIGAWDQLYQVILKERKDIPF